jgi:hypothetical protein
MSMTALRARLRTERARQYTLAGELLLLVLASSLAGAGASSSTRFFHHPAHVNSSLFLAAVPIDVKGVAARDSRFAAQAATESVVAVQEEKLGEVSEKLTAGLQESRDDRRLLHDQIAKMANTETDHYNELLNRMNVDEARVTTVLWVVGFVFTVVQGTLIFLQLFHRKIAAAAEGAPSRA